MSLSATTIERLNKGALRSNMRLGDQLAELESVLQFARGEVFWVDPELGQSSPVPTASVAAGSRTKPFKSVEDAYAACVSGRGDVIVHLSAGTASAKTTSYLKKTLTWSKHNITVLGIAAPVAMYGRARIANKEVTTTSSVISQAEHSIDRESGSFVTDGWIVGQTGVIADSGSNNDATFTVTAVTALSLTVSETLNVQSKAEAGSCTLTSYNAAMIVVSGDNNRFVNMHIANFGTKVQAVGGVKITGNRNSFEYCHLIGAGHATPGAATGAYSLMVDGGQENTFFRTVFGTDTVLKAAANGEILFDSDAWRTRFYECEVVSYSATSTKGAIKIADATGCDGWQLFKNCTFLNWNENGIDLLAAALIGTKPNSGQIAFDSCGFFGYTAVEGAGMSGCGYVGNSAAIASGAGGIATSV